MSEQNLNRAVHRRRWLCVWWWWCKHHPAPSALDLMQNPMPVDAHKFGLVSFRELRGFAVVEMLIKHHLYNAPMTLIAINSVMASEHVCTQMHMSKL